MAIERRNPIPAGRYWIDCQGDLALAQFEIWTRTYANAIHVETTEESGKSAFHIFTLSKPTPRWEKANKGLGFPNVAGPDIHSKSDAYQVPVVETPNLLDILNNSSTLLVIGLVLYLLMNRGKHD